VKIFVPSAGRAGRVRTLDSLPARALQWVILIVPEREAADYAQSHQGIDVVGCPEKGIRATRQWIMDRAEGRVVFMDDDLRFRHREPGGSHISVDVAHGLLGDVGWAMDQGCFAVGLADEFMCQSRPPGLGHGRFNDVLCYDLDAIDAALGRDGRPKFRCEVNEEHDVHLQLLAAGLRTGVLSDWTKGGGARYAAGGCSAWRTAAVEEAGHRELARLHPEFVRIVPHAKSLSGWAIRVRWEAARRAGMSRAAGRQARHAVRA